eukprot:EG_transcript_12471
MASAAQLAIPIAALVPRDTGASVCVTGTVVVDRHAKDMEAIRSYFGHRIVGLPVTGCAPPSAGTLHNRLRRLQHPNILSYYDSFVRNVNDTKCLFIQLEYCEKGTLQSHLCPKQSRPALFTAEMVVSFITQLTSALEYIHNLGLLHGDLRPANILLTKEKRLKLGSFGSPLWIERHGCVGRTITGGDRVYAPPEWADSVVPHRRLRPTETPLPSYDMWSLGCVVTELATLKLLRQHRHCTAAIGGDPNKFQAIADDVAATHTGLFAPLCSALLTYDATERATACEAARLVRDLTKLSKTPRRSYPWLPNFWKCARPIAALPTGGA